MLKVSPAEDHAFKELSRHHWTVHQWHRLLAIHVQSEGTVITVDAPPMAGSYHTETNAIFFEPAFRIEPGVKYLATFNPAHLPGARPGAKLVARVFELPRRASVPTAQVTRVYPTASVLPENLLKFYVHFSAPMSGGYIYEHIRLRDEAGKDVELPFLEIDEELWNPTMTRLTLFIDPGRIKRGVQPLEEVGPALEEGKGYTLLIEAAWKDAANVPLKQGFQKRFMVGPANRQPIDPARWKVESPKAGTREPLTITFTEFMDHALALRVIRVLDGAGQLIEGEAALENEERRWVFIPARSWGRGSYTLSVQSTIEDLAGNNIGKAFEVDLFEGVQRRFTNSTVKLPFVVE